jgi:hypothetical protein
LDSTIRPSNALKAFLFADDYSFGVLQSDTHYQWFLAKGSSLKGDPRYTPDTVFDTFPWPQSPTEGQITAVADTAVALRELRRDTMERLNYSRANSIARSNNSAITHSVKRMRGSTLPSAPLTECGRMLTR